MPRESSSAPTLEAGVPETSSHSSISSKFTSGLRIKSKLLYLCSRCISSMVNAFPCVSLILGSTAVLDIIRSVKSVMVSKILAVSGCKIFCCDMANLTNVVFLN